MIFSDAKRIKQILFNLLGNAIKFTYEGTIALLITAVNQGQSLEFSVRDTGVGIKEEDLGKLFRFFGQASSSKDINRGGMGLGLTISKMIIQQMGGGIDVQSEFGKGSNFFFSIPMELQILPSHSEEQGLQESEINQVNRPLSGPLIPSSIGSLISQ
jgi:signal transduction histidine kinase